MNGRGVCDAGGGGSDGGDGTRSARIAFVRYGSELRSERRKK